MGEYLTERVRLEQTEKKRVFRTLDNELYKDDDGTIYIVPRYFCTDNYTIPMWVSWLGGSPVDYRVEPSHLHDLGCYCLAVVYTVLSEEELKEKGYYRYSIARQLWACDNIPSEFLRIKFVNKKEANDLLYRAMRAAGIPLLKRCLIRAGVFFNIGWYIRQWQRRIIEIDLDRFYEKGFWDGAPD